MSQRQLQADILQQGITFERAKLLFSIMLGPLPEVEVPPGDRDLSDFDGTLAVAYIAKYWDSLTPEQRAAAARLIHIGPPPNEPRVARASLLPELPSPRFLKAANQPAFDYDSLAEDASVTLAAFLQVPPMRYTVTPDYGPPPGTEYAHTWSWFYSYTYPNKPKIMYPDGCEITIHNRRFESLPDYDAKAIVTHEMFHCFQQRTSGSPDAQYSLPAWIVEGEPTWAMAVVVPQVDNTIMGDKWPDYLNKPTQGYQTRSYDAVGLFGHLSDVAGDAVVWPRLLPLVTLGKNGNDTAAFNALLQAQAVPYFTSWGSSYFRVSDKTPWNILGPGTPPPSSLAPTQVAVNSGSDEALAPALSYEGRQFQLTGSPDLLVVSLLSGYGRLHDANFALDTALDISGPLALCLKTSGCKCPDGSPGASMSTKRATMPLSIGINGGETTAVVGVIGYSLDRFCPQPEPQTSASLPPGTRGAGGGGGGGGEDEPPPGGSVGDTHLTTFDGLHYDFQVIGEYTLVRSTRDELLVQVRQVPVRGPKVASVSQAVACRVGSQRVTITLENNTPVVRVDGSIVSGELPRLKSGSLAGSSSSFGGVYQISWPDGTRARIAQITNTLNVYVFPKAARRGALEGLLGNFDGSPDNDLVADGRGLGTNFTRDDINHTLANAWRVDQGASLFDYAPGQSSRSFIDPQFPAKDAEAGSISDRQSAEKTCRDNGITDQHLLDDCILDLAVTNDLVFGLQYAHAQRVLAMRTLLAAGKSGPIRETIWMTGAAESGQGSEFQFDARAGDVIWIAPPDCTDRSVFLQLHDPSGALVGSNEAGCEFGWAELPASGTYTFRATAVDPEESAKGWRIPIRFVRPTRRAAVVPGQMISGTIEERGARDYYSLEAKQGDLIRISGEACQLGNLTANILDDQGLRRFSLGCGGGSANSFRVERDGRYELVINWDNRGGTGPYRFVFQQGKLTP
ncbi:MAG: VWD domain-containing protein [Steroidobacteraceae bacterium]